MDALRLPPEDQKIGVPFLRGERRRVALCRLLLQQPDILASGMSLPTIFGC